MGLFKSAVEVAAINFRRWMKDIRVRFTLIFIGYMIYIYVGPYVSYGIKTGQECSGWLLPILFRSASISIGSPKTILHIGMLLLLCDAPFFSPVSPYMILRSRRTAWWLGECLYIVGAALLYTLFISGMCIVLALPVLTLENDWGGVLKDLAYGITEAKKIEAAAASNLQFGVHTDMVRYLFPQGAQLYVFAALWGSFSFLGLLMYLVSLIKRNVLVGMSAAAVFIFLDPFLVWDAITPGMARLKLLCPVIWTSIDQTQVLNRSAVISVPIALSLYVILSIFLCILIAIYSKRTMIEVNR